MDPITLEQEKKLMKTVASGSATEAIGGLAAVVLAIIGLAGIVPQFMLAIASIVIGVSLLTEGGATAAEYSDIMARTPGGGRTEVAELGGGVTAESLAGGTAVVLGILALIGLSPAILMAISAIVLGVGVLMGAGVVADLNKMRLAALSAEDASSHRVAREATSAATGGQVLVGLAAIVLGILALVGFNPMVLTLVAMLALGVSILLSGSAVTGRLYSMFSNRHSF